MAEAGQFRGPSGRSRLAVVGLGMSGEDRRGHWVESIADGASDARDRRDHWQDEGSMSVGEPSVVRDDWDTVGE